MHNKANMKKHSNMIYVLNKKGNLNNSFNVYRSEHPSRNKTKIY